jgi:hypothetical protein
VGDGAPGQRDREQVALGFLGALLDGQRHFLGLAVAEADAAVAVADHHECGERESTTALHHLGDAVDGDDARLAQSVGIGSRRFAAALVAEIALLCHQNSKPASRAAAATAATRPW